MSVTKGWKRLRFEWTAPKGVTAMATFLITALLVEYLVAWIFMSVGLTDTSSLTHVVSVPFTGWVFNVAISPLFHLVPLGVIVVLVSSWAYLLRQLVIVPQRIESRKSYPARRERPKPKRFKRFSTGVGSKLRGVGRIFKPRPLGLSGEVITART